MNRQLPPLPVIKIAVMQLGARMHYAIPRIFERHEMLQTFYTDAYVGNKPLVKILISKAVKGRQRGSLIKLLGRDAKDIPRHKVISFDWLGFEYQSSLDRAPSFTKRMEIHAGISSRFCLKVARSGLKGSDAIWAFNGAALETFERAREMGKFCVLEQTMAPYHVHDQLLQKEKQRWSGWQPDLELMQGKNPFGEREVREWELADRIVCGSQFVVDGIAQLGGPVEKCVIIPYAVDLENFVHIPKTPVGDRPIRVLFAGEVGLRKGVPYLLNALSMMGPGQVQARLAGRVKIPEEITGRYSDVARFEGFIPRSAMPELFTWADVFVLPSVVEGSATVIYEAVASGLPVVCSPNSGALRSSAVCEVDCTDKETLARAITNAARHQGTLPPDEETKRAYGFETYSQNIRNLFNGAT